jgi:hypothetical protein
MGGLGRKRPGAFRVRALRSGYPEQRKPAPVLACSGCSGRSGQYAPVRASVWANARTGNHARTHALTRVHPEHPERILINKGKVRSGYPERAGQTRNVDGNA